MVSECEALLAGTYVELLESVGTAVPNWAWTNLLAHGTEEQLRDLSELRASSRSWSSNSWSRARAYLAGEVLDAAARCGSLRTLQRRALVPLELRLASTTEPTPITRPAEWVDAVQRAIADVPSRGTRQPNR